MIDSWDRLRVFAAVARHGSVAAAATELHLTGPAVSHHIRRLEHTLGTRLVERSGRGIRLTVAGRILAARSQEADLSVRGAEAEIAALAQQISGPVRVGASGTVLRGLAPILGSFARAHPQVSPEAVDADTVDLLPRLRRDEVDLVVAESWSPAPRHVGGGLVAQIVRVECARVAVPSDDPVAATGVIPASAFADARWATCLEGSDPSSGLQAVVADEHQGRLPHIAFRVNDFATALALVREGLAWAMVTDLSRPDCGVGVVLCDISPQVTRTLSVVRRAATPRPAVAALATAISVGFGSSSPGPGVT